MRHLACDRASGVELRGTEANLFLPAPQSRARGNSGTGLQPLSKMQKPMNEVIPGGVKRYETAVTSFQPEQNTVSTADDSTLK